MGNLLLTTVPDGSRPCAFNSLNLHDLRFPEFRRPLASRLPFLRLRARPQALVRATRRPEARKVNSFFRRWSIPATESQLSVALALSVLVMSGLLWGILWQANIIAQQREAIRWLWSLHGGHIG
jgi:hypothetical protein